ncbi:hypothetical protein F4776DRAFT_605744 [Hypoxylon sp. NC0597]|nr:hypothetical protein F4776DRAFT_605744 [Hypoxylon sp. NC0597]
MSNTQENVNLEPKLKPKPKPMTYSENPESIADGSTANDWRMQLIVPAGAKRRLYDQYVSVNNHEKNITVHIGEWIPMNGKPQPSKTGISLTVQEFEQLVSVIPLVQAEIRRKQDDNFIDLIGRVSR